MDFDYGPSPLINQVPIEGLVSAKTWLEENSLDWSAGVTRGTAMTLQGKEITDIYAHGGCHSFISIMFGSMPEEGCLILSCHSKSRSDHLNPAAHSAIADFMASDILPFGKYIINRNDKDSIRNDGIVLLCGGKEGLQNVHHAMFVCKVLRYCTEQKHAIDVWYHLVQNGIPPLLALFVSEYFQMKSGTEFLRGSPMGHCSVFYPYSGGVKPGMLLQPLVLSKKPTGTHTIFKPQTSGGIEGAKFFASKSVPESSVSDGWGGKIKKAGYTLDDILSITKELIQACSSQVLPVEAKTPAKKQIKIKPEVKEYKDELIPIYPEWRDVYVRAI